MDERAGSLGKVSLEKDVWPSGMKMFPCKTLASRLGRDERCPLIFCYCRRIKRLSRRLVKLYITVFSGHCVVTMLIFFLSRCVWAEFLEESDEMFCQLLKMVTHFGLACEMPAMGNNIDTPDGAPTPVCYLIPWFFKNSRPWSMRMQWPVRADAKQVRLCPPTRE